MINIIAVGMGGFIGASLRYLISEGSLKLLGNNSLPYGTLFVNILGGFLIGFIMVLSTKTGGITPTVKMFLTTGLLGGLTTFSTFSYETINLISNSNYMLGGINACLNLSLSLTGVWLGKYVVQFV
jgi:CrcB protein